MMPPWFRACGRFFSSWILTVRRGCASNSFPLSCVPCLAGCPHQPVCSMKEKVMMRKMMLAAGLLATASWLGLATAQQPPRPAAPPPPAPGAAQPPGPGAQPAPHQGGAVPMNPKNDQQFIEWAATRNAMELEMGSMAARKAPSQQVRQFGQMLATDHGRSNAKAV